MEHIPEQNWPRIDVLIPSSSGLRLERTGRTGRTGRTVLIPSSSGLRLEHGDRWRLNETEVLIPSSSGLRLEPDVVGGNRNRARLNPFFIRSQVGTIPEKELQVYADGLNPFFIRSQVGTVHDPAPEESRRVLIPSSSGLRLERHGPDSGVETTPCSSRCAVPARSGELTPGGQGRGVSPQAHGNASVAYLNTSSPGAPRRSSRHRARWAPGQHLPPTRPRIRLCAFLRAGAGTARPGPRSTPHGAPVAPRSRRRLPVRPPGASAPAEATREAAWTPPYEPGSSCITTATRASTSMPGGTVT